MQKNHFLLLKKLKHTVSAQLCSIGRMCTIYYIGQGCQVSACG